jgi:hypothetical protein
MTTEATLLTSALLGHLGRYRAGSPLELDHDRAPSMHIFYVSDPDGVPAEFVEISNLDERIGVGW